MLMSEMQDLTEKLNKWGLKSPRPWNEFAGILKKPKNKQELEERLQTNFMLYKANYILLLAGIMSWSVIISPFTMGILFVCAGVFALLLGWPQPLEIFGRLLTPKEKTMIAASCKLSVRVATSVYSPHFSGHDPLSICFSSIL